MKSNLVVFVIVFIFMGCSSQSAFEDSLKERLSSGTNSVVPIEECAPFKWDTLHVYAPYSRFRDIKRETGFRAASFTESIMFIDFLQDSECILVFKLNGKLVEGFRLSRSLADFANVSGHYSKSDAVFILRLRGEDRWPYLEKPVCAS